VLVSLYRGFTVVNFHAKWGTCVGAAGERPKTSTSKNVDFKPRLQTSIFTFDLYYIR